MLKVGDVIDFTHYTLSCVPEFERTVYVIVFIDHDNYDHIWVFGNNWYTGNIWNISKYEARKYKVHDFNS
jgi:hypothetical protein